MPDHALDGSDSRTSAEVAPAPDPATARLKQRMASSLRGWSRGLTDLAGMAGVARQFVGRWADPEASDFPTLPRLARLPPGVVRAFLEGWLADLPGSAAVGGSVERLVVHAAAMLGEVSSAVEVALADGKIDATEAATIRRVAVLARDAADAIVRRIDGMLL